MTGAQLTFAQPEMVTNNRDWHFAANVSYSSRSLDGSIVNRTHFTNDTFGTLIATGDSMGVGTRTT